MALLDHVLAGYVECALETTVGDDGDTLDGTFTPHDLDASSLAAMRDDCERFVDAHPSCLALGARRAGADLWLSRNGHGTGFFDGDYPNAAALQSAARALGESSLLVEGEMLSIYPPPV